MKKYIKIASILLISALLSSCEGFLDTTPSDQGSSETSMLTLQDATYATNGMYALMKNNTYYGTYILIMGETRADDLRPTRSSTGWWAIYTYDMSPYNNTYFDLWHRCYKVIMTANTIIEGWDQIPDTNPAAKNDILGQAYAVRALCFFDLAKTYGYPYAKDNGASLGASLITERITSADDAKVPRSTVAQTYAQALSDLALALPLLKKPSVFGSVQTDRFDYWAAKLLQARILLYKGDWDASYSAAAEVVNSSPYRLMSRDNYLTYWKKEGAQETLVELLATAESNYDSNVGIDSWFHSLWHKGSNPSGTLIVTDSYAEMMESDPDDIRSGFIRRDSDVGGLGTTPWLGKYSGNDDASSHAINNLKILRLSEAYMIAAEAGMRSGKSDAKSYLDAIKLRANPDADLDYTLTEDEILLERRKEFIAEGHRFFDLMRLGKTIVRDRTTDHGILPSGETESVDWNYYKVALPIQASQITLWGDGILQQNPGYPN